MCLYCYSLGLGDTGGGDSGDVFRFHREDFGPLPWAPLHYDLHFDFPLDSNIVAVTSRQTYMNRTSSESRKIELNAHDLEILGCNIYSGAHTPLGEPPVGIDAVVPDFVSHVKELDGLSETIKPVKYDYDKDKRIITIHLPKAVKPNEEVVIQTKSTCAPNDSVLEGIYFDYTLSGKPQTMISQCQQYGFQRIVPCMDTMNGKTFYTTTIIASNEYTNIISNGDLQGQYTPTADKKRLVATYYNHKVNMAPYLFFIGVGNYDTHVSEVEYPSGQTFRVEILALPGVVEKKSDADAALKSLVDSIIWTQVSNGPEKYQHEKERSEIYTLIAERDELKQTKQSKKRLGEIRQRLRELISVWGETGYTYTGSCYREIAMQNSNYGGMENVGNTTILSSKLTPSRWMDDAGARYMEKVKIHEFYHNINGSQVTGDTPFEIWLNEAVTVFVERLRTAELFGHEFDRIEILERCRIPNVGPLAEDKMPAAMAIEPAGFNTTHELISGMTYSKAPEFVGMVELIIGRENFVKALFNYYSKYAYSNATSGQWIDCMAEFQPAGVDLRKMARGWLQRTGHPTVHVESQEYENNKMSVKLSQTGFEDKAKNKDPWIIPIKYAAIINGKAVKSGVHILDTKSNVLNIPGLDHKPDFVSIGCDFSFFGSVLDFAHTPEQKLLQAKQDPNGVNRYLAYQDILDSEKVKMVEAIRSGIQDDLIEVSASFIELYGDILEDPNLADDVKGKFLKISSSINTRPDYSHFYWHLSYARTAVLQAVYKSHGKKIRQRFEELKANSSIRNRALKFALFDAIRAGEHTEPVFGPKKEEIDIAQARDYLSGLIFPFLDADNMEDMSYGLRNLLELGGSQAKAAQEKAKKEWTKHTIGCEAYISTVGRADSEHSTELITELIKEPFFNVSIAGHSRSLFRCWCANTKRSLLTKKGLALTKDLFLKFGKVNQMSVYGAFGTFGDPKRFDLPVQEKLVGTLREMKAGLDSKEQESLYNKLTNVLANFQLTGAVEAVVANMEKV